MVTVKKKILERIEEIVERLELIFEIAEIADTGICVELTVDGDSGVKAGFVGDCLIVDVEPLGISYDGVLRLMRAAERMGVKLPFSAEDIACAIATLESGFKLGAMACRISDERLRKAVEKAAEVYKENVRFWR